MMPIDQQSKEYLEYKIVGYKVCPLTAKTVGKVVGQLALVLATKYVCSVDDGTARGGIQTPFEPESAATPCSEEYAKTCPLYIKQAEIERVRDHPFQDKYSID